MWFWILWHCWHDPDAVLVSDPFALCMTLLALQQIVILQCFLYMHSGVVDPKQLDEMQC